MTRLRRAVRVLEGRRQRAILEREPGLPSMGFELAHVAKFDWGLTVAWFAGLAVLLNVVDMSIAYMNQMPRKLDFGPAVLTAGVLATIVGLYQHRRAKPAVPVRTRYRDVLARALQHELDRTGESRARVEQLDIEVARAFAWIDGPLAVALVLDAGEGEYVVLQGPTVEARFDAGWRNAVPGRVTVEALQSTRTIVSISAAGVETPVRSIELAPLALEGVGECEVRTTEELPEALADVVRSPLER